MLDSVFALGRSFSVVGSIKGGRKRQAARSLKQNPYRERFIRVETFTDFPRGTTLR